ncbi:MAG: hypothetical protein K2X66_04410 [Cyanobacteria bacterium]|nr:hypothetical protein [Cyanobacteriota bacterium]
MVSTNFFQPVTNSLSSIAGTAGTAGTSNQGVAGNAGTVSSIARPAASVPVSANRGMDTSQLLQSLIQILSMLTGSGGSLANAGTTATAGTIGNAGTTATAGTVGNAGSSLQAKPAGFFDFGNGNDTIVINNNNNNNVGAPPRFLPPPPPPFFNPVSTNYNTNSNYNNYNNNNNYNNYNPNNYNNNNQYPTPPVPPTPPPFPPFPPNPFNNNGPVFQLPNGGNGRIWGDPHVESLLNGVTVDENIAKFAKDAKVGEKIDQRADFMGTPGQTYLALADDGLQISGTVGAFGKPEDKATVYKELGVKIRGEDGQTYGITTAADGKPSVVTQPDGSKVTLKDGVPVQLGGPNMTATWSDKDKKLNIAGSKEYESLSVTQVKNPSGDYLDLGVKTGKGYDGRNADGLLGVTARPDITGTVKSADPGAKNGEGVLTKGKDGRGADRTEADYKVSGGVLGTPDKLKTNV